MRSRQRIPRKLTQGARRRIKVPKHVDRTIDLHRAQRKLRSYKSDHAATRFLRAICYEVRVQAIAECWVGNDENPYEESWHVSMEDLDAQAEMSVRPYYLRIPRRPPWCFACGRAMSTHKDGVCPIAGKDLVVA